MTLLPDIIKMLKMTQSVISLFENDKKAQDAFENMSFSEFAQQLIGIHLVFLNCPFPVYLDEQQKNYQKCFASFKHAWELCQHELDNGSDTLHAFMSVCFIGRLFEFKNYYVQLEIGEETKMKFLIPTTYGPGVITTGLIDHLVISHNKFIRLCRKFVEDSLKK